MGDQENNSAAETDSNGKTAWTKPVLRTSVPVSRSRGGGGDVDNQDDIFYRIS